MKSFSRLMWIPIFVGVGVSLSLSQTPGDAFNKGNEYYRAGRFEEAVKEYESVVKQGYSSAALYFNVGNTYFRIGKIAPAILAYERAERLDPNDPDIEHNLKLASYKTVDRIEALPEIFFVRWLKEFVALLPLQTTTSLFLACWILFFGSLAAFYVLRQESFFQILRSLTIGSSIILLPVAALFITQLLQFSSHDEAILMDKVITAKTSPDTYSVDAFVVHEGLKVKLGDALGDWVKITLADGKVGWIQSSQVERI